MNLNFRSYQLNFDSCADAIESRTGYVDFDTDVAKAEAAVSGFFIEFEKEDRKFQQMIVGLTNVEVNGKRVTFTGELGIKDNSGHFDDPYGGRINILVIAECKLK